MIEAQPLRVDDAGTVLPSTESISAARLRTVRENKRRGSIARREALYRRSLAVSDIAAFAVALSAGALASGAALKWGALAGAIGIVLLAKLLGLYDRDQNRLHKETLGEMPAIFSLATIASLLTYLVYGLMLQGEIQQAGVLVMWGTLAAALFFGRALTRTVLSKTAGTERCLVIGDLSTAEMLTRKLKVQGLNAEVVAVLSDTHEHDLASTRDLTERLRRAVADRNVDRVILASAEWRPDEILHAIGDLKASGVRVSVLPPISRLATLSYEVDQLPGIALLGMQGFEITRSSKLVKRGFDIVFSSLALALMAPVLAAIAIAVRLDSPGPALFRQRRIGKLGESFNVFKFRSMVEGADETKVSLEHLNEADGLFKITDDPRITRVGRLIRRWSLDELPQLLNVLRGEMSLVGPRPLIPAEDERIQGAYRRRLDIPPGMTGHWQILGSWRVPIDEMATLDYLYFANWSLWRDVKLLVQTIPYVLSGKNT